MGLTWFVGWAGVGFLMEIFDPNGQIADIWPAVLGIPGFFGGEVFSVVLRVSGLRQAIADSTSCRVPGSARWARSRA
jgi:hypothetical protein